MSSSNIRKRREVKKQKVRKNQMIMGVTLIAIIGVVALLIASGRLGGSPVIADARAELDPIKGPVDAPVTIAEYGSYACQACRSWHQAGIVETILEEYPDQVKFVFRDFPIISPAYDNMAAQIAQCALDQGNDQFWQFHDAMYNRQQFGQGSAEDVIAVGKSIGLDADKLSECYYSGTHQNTVQYDLQRARDLGLRAAPSFVVNGERAYNATPDLLRQMIDSALANS